MSIFDQSTAAESAITQNEHNRANLLEVILKYDSMMKARESKQEIQEQIKNLNAMAPIAVNQDDQPVSKDDLEQLFSYLKEYDEDKKPVSKFELRTMFDKLQAHYVNDPSDKLLPLTWG